MATRNQRESRRLRAAIHRSSSALAKKTALAESQQAAKRAKKGKNGIVTEMAKRGYAPTGKGSGWRKDPTLKVES